MQPVRREQALTLAGMQQVFTFVWLWLVDIQCNLESAVAMCLQITRCGTSSGMHWLFSWRLFVGSAHWRCAAPRLFSGGCGDVIVSEWWTRQSGQFQIIFRVAGHSSEPLRTLLMTSRCSNVHRINMERCQLTWRPCHSGSWPGRPGAVGSSESWSTIMEELSPVGRS